MSNRFLFFFVAGAIDLLAGCTNGESSWIKRGCDQFNDPNPGNCVCEDFSASNEDWACPETTCCQKSDKYGCSSKPSCFAATGGSGTGGSSGTGSSTSTGGTTPVVGPLVTLTNLTRDNLMLEPCQPFTISWEYANLGDAPAPAPAFNVVPRLWVIRFTTSEVLVSNQVPWKAGLEPYVPYTTTGLETQSHTMESGLDPGVASGVYSDAAGWTCAISPIPSLVEPLNVTIASIDPGYCGS